MITVVIKEVLQLKLFYFLLQLHRFPDRKLQAVHEENTHQFIKFCTVVTVTDWFRRFKNDNFKLEDNERSGAPKKFEHKEFEEILARKYLMELVVR